MDCTVHGVAKSLTRLSNFQFTSCDCLGSPGGTSGKEPTSGGFDPWVGKRQPTPVFLPGNPWTEDLAGYSSGGCKESNTAEHNTAITAVTA